MNQIKLAIEPLRQISVDNAEKKATSVVKAAIEILESNDWDLSLVAPRPSSNMWDRVAYNEQNSKYLLYVAITDGVADDNRSSYRKMRIRNIEREQKYINNAKEEANFAFDKYVAKMISKIGDVDSAELSNVYANNVWGYSILTVVKDGVKTNWKTQQIINCSKLGNLFNQWPTRKMK